MSASKSSPLSTISSARERPTKRGSHSSAPPPGTSPTPISGLPKRALCRLAKRMSQASTDSLPMPRVRPRILAMLTTRVDERRSHKVAPKAQNLWPFSCLGYVEMGDEKIGIRRLEHDDLHGRVRLEVGHQRTQFDDRCGNKHVD